MKKNLSVYSCNNGNCNNIFCFATNVSQRDIISFENVREILFRPHTSYERFIDGQHESQRVVFMELCEDIHSKKNPLHILDHLIDVENSDISTQASTSNEEKSVVRVCTFASESLFGVDQNSLNKSIVPQNIDTGLRTGFGASLWRTITTENDISQPNDVVADQVNNTNSTETSSSTVQQLLNACFCADENHTCSYHVENTVVEFVSVDLEDLLEENHLLFK